MLPSTDDERFEPDSYHTVIVVHWSGISRMLSNACIVSPIDPGEQNLRQEPLNSQSGLWQRLRSHQTAILGSCSNQTKREKEYSSSPVAAEGLSNFVLVVERIKQGRYILQKNE